MKFHLVYEKASGGAQSPVHVVEQKTGHEVGWINRYLDREYVRRLSNKSLRLYAYNLLHFVRWWASVHHTGDVAEWDLTESILLEYIRFQSAQDPVLPVQINTRVATADRALRNEFPDAPCQVARGFHQYFLHRRPMGLGRPRLAVSRLRVKEPKRCIVPLSVDEVARFWASFRTARDLAIVGLMLLQGLRSAEVLALIGTTSCFPKANYAFAAKATSSAFLRWLRRPYSCSITISGWNGPILAAPQYSFR
jgi:integrase